MNITGNFNSAICYANIIDIAKFDETAHCLTEQAAL